MPNASIELISTITCPECDRRAEVEMPTESCQFFWECPACETVLRAKEGGLLRVLFVRDAALSTSAKTGRILLLSKRFEPLQPRLRGSCG